MEKKDNGVYRIFRFIGICLIYLVGVLFILSSGCFLLVGVSANGAMSAPFFIIGIALGVFAFFLIKFSSNKNKDNDIQS